MITSCPKGWFVLSLIAIMCTKRPRIKLRKTKSDVFIEIASFVLVCISALLISFFYSRLPDEIAISFNWPTKDSEGFVAKSTLWMNPLIGGGIITLLYTLNQFPWIFNYPVKITTKNAQPMYRIASQLLRYISLVIGLLSVLFSLHPILDSFDQDTALIIDLLPILLIVILGLIVYTVIKMILLNAK